jgi:ABC-type molybdate transport system substrate-binding protein
MQRLVEAGHLAPGTYRRYLHNRLALMVPSGNPAGIRRVADLGRADVRISQPDPANEDIAWHILDMYRKAGGEALVHRIMEEKRTAGTTLLTAVHHRETPQRIVDGTVDVGPVWATEIQHAATRGIAVEAVEPGPDLDQRRNINYFLCRLKAARNPKNAELFCTFLLSAAAQDIFKRHGFVPALPI